MSLDHGALEFQISDVVMGEWVPTSPRLGSFYTVKKPAVLRSFLLISKLGSNSSTILRDFVAVASRRWSEFVHFTVGTSLA